MIRTQRIQFTAPATLIDQRFYYDGTSLTSGLEYYACGGTYYRTSFQDNNLSMSSCPSPDRHTGGLQARP
jgi:hypothetical protein